MIERLDFQVAVLVTLLALYLLTNSWVFSLLVVIALVFFFLYETWKGVKEHGWRKEFEELLKTLFGIIVFYIILRITLGTEIPISAVASCSMVPSLNKGDLVIVAGWKINAPTLNIRDGEEKYLFSPEVNVSWRNKTFLVNGSVYAFCTEHSSEICAAFFKNPEEFVESRGPFKFYYGLCKRGIFKVPCFTKLTYREESFLPGEGDIIVYEPAEKTLFSLQGDIIHRAFLRIVNSTSEFYLTLGDNNEVLDIQFFHNGLYNEPAVQVLGKVIFKIPLLGYYRVFLAGILQDEEICKLPLVRK